MKTKLFTLFLTLAISVGTLFAVGGTCGNNLTWNLTDGVLTISGTGPMSEYYVWEGYDTNDPAPWYKYRTSIKRIIITKGVTSIGSHAFYGCTDLASVDIPNSVTDISMCAFYNCSGLTTITIPNSVSLIMANAFYRCSSLTRIEIPASVILLGNGAFAYCSSLISIHVAAENINYCSVEGVLYNKDKTKLIQYPAGRSDTYTIPNSVTSIGDYAFSGCSGLTSITIPNSVTSIGGSAFSGCSGLTSIEIPNSVTSIGVYICGGCTNLTSIVWNVKNYADFTNTMTPFYYASSGNTAYDLRAQITSFVIGEGVESIPAYLCDGMKNLTTLSIGNSVQTIGDYAFAGLNNRKINQLVLPNSLKAIGNYAFSGGEYIESIHFGSSLESIGANAFSGCTRVATMTCLADVTPNVGTKGLESISFNAILYVPNSCLQKYKVDANWNRFIIEPLSASDVLDPGNNVSIIAEDNMAIFTWPTNTNAQLYQLEIFKDGELVCTLTFNGSGQLAEISFAPSRDGHTHAPEAIMTAAGMQFTVTGLSYATIYTYALTVKDGSSQVIASYSGQFGTTGAYEGLDDIDASAPATKIIRDGQIYILRGDKTFTLTGQEIK